MPELTLFPTSDAFNNNISGFYDGETFLVSHASSSSNANEADILVRFPAAGLPAAAIITAVTAYFYCTANNDGMGVASYTWYCDVNDVWGTLDASDPPTASIFSGTQLVGSAQSNAYTVNAWNSHPFTVVSNFPKNAAFNVGITADLGDLGPANLDMDSIENTNSRSPYPAGTGHTDGRMFLVITYNLPSSPQRTLVGVGT